MKIVNNFFNLLSKQERRKLYLLFIAVILMATMEVVSLGSITPFLSVASEPSSIESNRYLRWAYNYFGFESTSTFLIALGVGALCALLISNLSIVATTWALERYIWNRNHSLSRRLLRGYLYRPYEYFLTKNSSELGKNILEEVKEVTAKMLSPALRGGAKAIVAIFIFGFLFVVNPIVAGATATVLGGAYALVYVSVRRHLEIIGKQRVDANTDRYQLVNEAFGGIKQVKLRGKEETLLNQFDGPSKRYASTKAVSRIIRKIPRYILEAIAFGGIIMIAIYLIVVQDNIRQVIPMLGLYAFAGYRLMPALQSAFNGIAAARFNAAALENLYEDMRQYSKIDLDKKRIRRADQPEQISLDRKITMSGVYYSYPNTSKWAVKDFCIEIPATTSVGFVGKTGSGKTTVVDLLVGLLKPRKGNIKVDNTVVSHKNIHDWQRQIGYIPQQIYLSDDTVKRNIAFGVPREDIKMERLKEACKKAQIYEFITEELKEQWNTVVGEKGTKLSGGQRQRIGIARALYHDPKVLVLDEATSALDQSTESNVMRAIYELHDEYTLVIVAHRLSTVKQAEKIIMMEEGMKAAEGPYEDLIKNNTSFRNLTSAEPA